MVKIKTDVVVLGAGAIGLAIARELSSMFRNLIVIEQERQIGSHTSSRNSEVIHSGIYYENSPFKEKLCLEGKSLLYDYIQKREIEFDNCGKLIFATKFSDVDYIYKIIENSNRCGVAHTILNTSQLNKFKDIIKPYEGVFINETSIFDSHNFLMSLEFDTRENDAIIALNTQLRSIHIEESSVILDCNNNGENILIDANIVINALGHHALDFLKDLYPEKYAEYENFYVKGHYFSHSLQLENVPLLYPVPNELGLGVHLTKDLAGQVRFGPDTVPVASASSYKPKVSKTQFLQEINANFHSIQIDKISFSYSGIRPKLKKNSHIYSDFLIATDLDGKLISLVGIDSPGLTASLAIGRHVKKIFSER